MNNTVFNTVILWCKENEISINVKSFRSNEAAMRYLHSEYMDTKLKDNIDNDILSYDVDNVHNIAEDKTLWFGLEIYDSNYWVRGEIQESEIE